MEYVGGFENQYRQKVEYRKAAGSDQEAYILRCGYCDEQYPAYGELEQVQCPVCDRGTPRVAFAAEEYLNALALEAEDTVSFFRNERKPERERSVCAAFLRCLGIEFGLKELAPGPHEPIDVTFRSARFQIREMLDPGRKRDLEWKKELALRRQAVRLEETMKPYTPPRSVTHGELFAELRDALESKRQKYEEMYPEGCRELDALVYVNWNAHLDTGSAQPPADDLKNQNWRSVSLLFWPYAEVVFANDGAPDFLRERQGHPLSMWRRPGLFSV